MAGEVIAVIDNDDLFGTLMDDLLTDEGYQTVIGQDGAGAFELIQRARPALVLLDLWIETRDAGLAVLERLRLDPTTSTIPVIAYTNDRHHLHDQAEQLRAYDCDILSQPFEVDDLLARVTAALAWPGAGSRNLATS